MGNRSDVLASQLEQALADFAKAVEACPANKWGAVCDAEGWTVAQTAQHVAGQFPLEKEFIEEAAAGGKGLAYTWDDVNGKNDTRAAANAACTKDEVLKFLRDGGGSMVTYIRSLSDSQLDSSAPLALAGGAAPTAEQLIQGGVLIEHVTGHLASIKSVT